MTAVILERGLEHGVFACWYPVHGAEMTAVILERGLERHLAQWAIQWPVNREMTAVILERGLELLVHLLSGRYGVIER